MFCANEDSFQTIFDANLVCTTDRKIIEQSSQKTNDHAIFDPIGFH